MREIAVCIARQLMTQRKTGSDPDSCEEIVITRLQQSGARSDRTSQPAAVSETEQAEIEAQVKANGQNNWLPLTSTLTSMKLASA